MSRRIAEEALSKWVGARRATAAERRAVGVGCNEAPNCVVAGSKQVGCAVPRERDELSRFRDCGDATLLLALDRF